MRADRVGFWRVVIVSLILASVLAPRADAQRLLADGVKDLADQISTKAKEQQKLRIAVLPFQELEGRPTVLGTFLAEELFTHLVNAGLEIIERQMLDKVLGEIGLGETGVIDTDTAKKVGKVIGVDAVVTGSMTDLQSYVAINCRLIDASTGRIFGAAQTKVVKDDDVRKLLAALPAGSPSASPREGGSGPGHPAGVASKPRQVGDFVREEEEIRFEVVGCAASGTSATCEVLITNQGADRQLYLMTRGTRLLDAAGGEAPAVEVTIGASSREGRAAARGASALVVSGVATRGRLRFSPVDVAASEAALVELVFSVDRKDFRVQFRGVPLTRR